LIIDNVVWLRRCGRWRLYSMTPVEEEPVTGIPYSGTKTSFSVPDWSQYGSGSSWLGQQRSGYISRFFLWAKGNKSWRQIFFVTHFYKYFDLRLLGSREHYQAFSKWSMRFSTWHLWVLHFWTSFWLSWIWIWNPYFQYGSRSGSREAILIWILINLDIKHWHKIIFQILIALIRKFSWSLLESLAVVLNRSRN